MALEFVSVGLSTLYISLSCHNFNYLIHRLNHELCNYNIVNKQNGLYFGNNTIHLEKYDCDM